MDETKQNKIEEVTNSLGSSGISRKDFFKYTGAACAAAATFGMVGCEDDGGGTGPNPNAVYLGKGDVGVLNYAYALEQLEAAFYIEAVAGGALSGDELDVFKDIRDHEVAHADFYKAALTAVAPDAIIPALTPNFSEIDFGDRNTVVNIALTFENTGVSAYNGAGAMLKNPDFLVVAGKIVSVEARHAAAISDIAIPMEGIAKPDIIDSNGLDLARSVGEVYKIVDPFIEETLDPSGLPSQSYLN